MNTPTVTFEDVKRFLAQLPQEDQIAVQELISRFFQILDQANPLIASIALCLITELFLANAQIASAQKFPPSPTPTNNPPSPIP